MATNPDTPEPTIFDKLAEPFAASCIEWLPKKILEPRNPDNNGRGVGKALALCYIDARSVMARLDEVMGPDGWQDSYRNDGGRTICRLELLINGQWIGKEDGSGDSQVEAEKGGISGAFKRAAVKWGIGRYLYDVDEVWAPCNVKVTRGQGGRNKTFHNGWTDEGKEMLAMALNSAPGPRETGKPLGVQTLLDSINKADTVPQLQKLHSQHWKAVPLEYRAEVLRNLDRRKAEIIEGLNDEPDQGEEPSNDERDYNGEPE